MPCGSTPAPACSSIRTPEAQAVAKTSRVALVTGGGSGIGRAVALAFAATKAHVVVAGRREAEGRETARMIVEGGGQSFFVRTDVSREADVEAMVATTVERFGRLDFACNSAGVDGKLGPRVHEETVEDFDHVIGINLRGVWLCMKHEIRGMLAGAGGAIVNIASVNGVTATPGGAAYGASKAGVISLTRSAAVEYATDGVRVNAISAGFFQAPMLHRQFGRVGNGDSESGEETFRQLVPMKRIGHVDEVAAAAVWLCSDRASYITGHALAVDGGVLA